MYFLQQNQHPPKKNSVLVMKYQSTAQNNKGCASVGLDSEAKAF